LDQGTQAKIFTCKDLKDPSRKLVLKLSHES